MAEGKLQGLKVAALVADYFEQVELTEPMKALQKAGAEVSIVSPHGGKVQAVNHIKPAEKFDVDVPLDQADAGQFDALLLPGGALNPDALRTIDQALSFVKGFDQAGKPIAVICHGPWTLVSANLVKGRTITSWPSLKDDIINAGGKWVDREVVVDGNWVSSRQPADIPAFNREMINLFARQVEQRKAA